MNEWRCKECGWIGKDYLTASNPFDEGDTLTGCPNCRDVNTLEGVCEIEGCTKIATCGTPTIDGYVRCCGQHYSMLQE